MSRFKKGEVREFNKICSRCGRNYISKSGSRKACPECCKCEECGAQMPNGSDRFCGRKCAAKWGYRTSDKVKLAIEKGLRNAHANTAQRTRKFLTGRPKPEMRGEKNHNWKGGGKRQARHTEMGRVEYKVWRASVFKRDGFICVLCHVPKQPIQAHHIVPWKREPERRYDPDNGVTLCKPCHYAINHRESHFEDRFENYVKSKTPCVLTQHEAETFNTTVTLNCSWCGKDFRRTNGNVNKTARNHFCEIRCRKAFAAGKRYSPELPFIASAHQQPAGEQPPRQPATTV